MLRSILALSIGRRSTTLPIRNSDMDLVLIVAFHLPLLLPFPLPFVQVRFALLPRPVRMEQHPSRLIVEVDADDGAFGQAQLPDHRLSVEMGFYAPALVQFQRVDDGMVEFPRGLLRKDRIVDHRCLCSIGLLFLQSSSFLRTNFPCRRREQTRDPVFLQRSKEHSQTKSTGRRNEIAAIPAIFLLRRRRRRQLRSNLPQNLRHLVHVRQYLRHGLYIPHGELERLLHHLRRDGNGATLPIGKGQIVKRQDEHAQVEQARVERRSQQRRGTGIGLLVPRRHQPHELLPLVLVPLHQSGERSQETAALGPSPRAMLGRQFDRAGRLRLGMSQTAIVLHPRNPSRDRPSRDRRGRIPVLLPRRKRSGKRKHRPAQMQFGDHVQRSAGSGVLPRQHPLQFFSDAFAADLDVEAVMHPLGHGRLDYLLV
mmetsp:Transcript_25659/g.43787  ORF Transcript_25659/g.43787 Transcript_25659/m.43787 type:complete len:425 (+) Transcript_25659:119-1393(+)